MSWLIVSLLAIIIIAFGKNAGKYRIVFVTFFAITMSIGPGLGGIDGMDHFNYVKFYDSLILENITKMKFVLIGESQGISGFETGFVLFSYIAKFLNLGEAGYFFLIAFVTNFFLGLFIYQFKYPAIAVLLYLVSIPYLQEGNLVRQMLAVSIFIWALLYLRNGNVKKYLVLCVVVGLFHTSAYFMMFLALLTLIKKYKSINNIYLVLFFLWCISLMSFLGWIPASFSSIVSMISYYKNYVVHDIIELSSTYVYTNMVYALFAFASMYIEANKNRVINEPRVNIILVVIVLNSIFLNFTNDFYWFYRLSLYFAPIAICTFPETISRLPIGKKRSIILTVITLYYITVLYRGFIINPNAPFFNNMYSLSDFFNNNI